MADMRKPNYISQNKIHLHQRPNLMALSFHTALAQELSIQNYQMDLLKASTDKFAFSFWHQNQQASDFSD